VHPHSSAGSAYLSLKFNFFFGGTVETSFIDSIVSIKPYLKQIFFASQELLSFSQFPVDLKKDQSPLQGSLVKALFLTAEDEIYPLFSPVPTLSFIALVPHRPTAQDDSSEVSLLVFLSVAGIFLSTPFFSYG